MNSAVTELTRSITGKHSLAACSVDELQQLTLQYPYFGPAQFLLTLKLKEENSLLYGQQSQKALLYFRDALWFDYVCSDNSETQITAVKKEEKQQKITEFTGPAIAPPVPVSESSSPMPSLPGEITIEPIGSDELHPATEEPLPEQSQEVIVPGPPELTVEPEETTPDAAIPKPLPEEKQPDTLGSAGLHPATEETLPGEPPETTVPELPRLVSEPKDTEETALVFEPYHTVDYFASQGIRPKEEERPRDRFSQQLKSFTEWLKTMKRLPVATTQPAVSQDKNIEQMAEHSIADREIVTEAMADVWEKQGNPEKAIAIYRKLSLLNPSKSAYFAAKIEHLKHP